MPSDHSEQSSAAQDGGLTQFSLLGGPFHDSIAKWMPQIGGNGATVLGAGLSVLLWLILALLAIAEGYPDRFFSLQAMAIHARMLVVIPLILLCQVFFDRAIRVALGALVDNGIIVGGAKAALSGDAHLLMRLSRSWQLQLGLLIAVVLFSIATPLDYRPGLSSYVGNATAAAETIAMKWYWLVCLPIFRFVFVRFLWLLCMWSYLVWRLSRTNLELVAEDPDLAGGLGLLEAAQEKLLIFVVAIAIFDAAALAEIFQHTTLDEQRVYVHIVLVALIGLSIIGGPLLFLVAPLSRCRRSGIVEFSALAREYAVRFRRRWILPAEPDYDNLLGSSDLQSLADIGGAYWRTKLMRVLPITRRLLLMILSCAAVPYLPLLLLKYPLAELLADMLRKIIGV